jgi:membrane associated rhomboid family serine protease
MRVAKPSRDDYVRIAMALSDRYYMRDEQGAPLRLPMYAILMIAITVAFAFQQINYVYLGWPLERYGALSTTGLARGYLWQFVTFQLLHGGLWHLVFNLMCIYFFGRFCESRFGWRRMLLLYVSAGVIGGILQMMLAWSLPSHYGHSVFGASAGACGLLAAFCVSAPDDEILVCFVIPLKARILLMISVGIALFFTVVPSDPGIAHAAHLGGLLFGAAFVRFGWYAREFTWRFPGIHLGRRSGPLVKVRFPKSSPALLEERPARKPEVPADFISKEVDPILEKISAHGIHSLTERERKILEAARARMDKK